MTDVAVNETRRATAAGRSRALRLLRDAFAVAGVMGILLTLVGLIPFQGERIGWGFARDLYAYWAADLADPYTTPVGVGFAYLYSPVFSQLLAPLKLLPFDVVSALWLVAGLAALWWLGALWMLVIPGVSSDLLLGNINVFVAVALALSIRWPATWAFPLLTKITPGIGIAWLLVSRQWRELLVVVTSTAGIIAASFLLQPDAWAGWIEVLTNSVSSRAESTAQFAPLPVRLGVAGVLVIAAGVWWRPWLLAVAALVAMPVIWPASLAVLAAIPRLLDVERSQARPLRAPRSRLADQNE